MSARRDTGLGQYVAGLKKKPKTGSGPVTTAPPSARGPGRPPGKKSDPDYRQHSVWLRRTTHRAAMAHLRTTDPDKADFSVLVEELVAAWNARQSK